MKNTNDTIGNRTRHLPTCSAVPQPTAPQRATLQISSLFILIVQEQLTRQAMYYSVIRRRVRVTIAAVERICITLSECVFVSNTQSASFLLCVI